MNKDIKSLIEKLENMTKKKVVLKEDSTSVHSITQLRDTFKYRVDIKDFIYGQKRTKEQKQSFRKLYNSLGISNEFKKRDTNNYGDLFIKVSSDETVCYYEDYSRFGPYYCVVGFKNRQQALKFKSYLNSIRSNQSSSDEELQEFAASYNLNFNELKEEWNSVKNEYKNVQQYISQLEKSGDFDIFEN